MHKGQRVLVMDFSPARGKTGVLIGTRHTLGVLPRMRFKYIVQLDSGEVVYAGAVQRIKHNSPVAA
jgi:hypothetical protein